MNVAGAAPDTLGAILCPLHGGHTNGSALIFSAARRSALTKRAQALPLSCQFVVSAGPQGDRSAPSATDPSPVLSGTAYDARSCWNMDCAS